MTPREIISAYLEALKQGNVEVAFSYFNPNALWHQPGNHRFSGLKSGLNEIGKMLSGMMEVTQGTFSLTPTDNLMINGNMAALPVHFIGKIEDRSMDMGGVDLFKIEDDKIIEVWLFSNDQALEDEFWGK